MKKIISVLLVAVLSLSCLAACGDDAGNGAEAKVGVGIHTDFTYASKDASAEKDGNAQADITMAGVLLDAEGKIVAVKIDAVQVKCAIDATGAVKTETGVAIKTKKELGLDYNMKATSAKIGNIKDGGEWFEQAEWFEKWCVGKTLNDLQGLALKDGVPTDTDLFAGCTMKVTGLQQAVVRAIKGATWTGAKTTDTLGLGHTAVLNSASAPADEKDGKCQAYINVAAVAQNAEGKITCAVIDSVQANSSWDATGKLTHDMTKEPTTKYDLKEGYNMKNTSAQIGVIEGGAEWYEQIEHFMTYVLGKDAAAVKAIAVKDGGYPTDTALTAKCTMKVADYISAVTEALAK